MLWKFVSRYAPHAAPDSLPELDQMLDFALAYYRDFIAPHQSYREPTEREARAMADLAGRLRELPKEASAEDIQSEVYETGKTHSFENLRDWFRALYECLLGHSQGPRMGSFIELYGIEETIALIEEKVPHAPPRH